MPGDSSYARELAARLVHSGRAVEAESALRLALYDEPEDPELYHSLAECLMAQERRADALDAFVAAVEFGPESAIAHAGIGRCELHPMRRAQAYAEAVRLAPGSFEYRLGLAESLIASGDTDAGVDQLISAVALAPGDLEITNMAGELMLETGRFGDAVELYERAIAEHPIDESSTSELAFCYRSLGRALGGLGRRAEALEALKASLFLADNPIEKPGGTVTHPGEPTLPG